MTEKITVKLFASLMRYLPVNNTKSHGFEHPIHPGATVGQVVDTLQLPRESLHIVLLNGVYLGPELRESTSLNDADVLSFWPAVAGG
ncbi:MAG: MoaD/ThiS family protein [Cycloclasticus sp.]